MIGTASLAHRNLPPWPAVDHFADSAPDRADSRARGGRGARHRGQVAAGNDRAAKPLPEDDDVYLSMRESDEAGDRVGSSPVFLCRHSCFSADFSPEFR